MGARGSSGPGRVFQGGALGIGREGGPGSGVRGVGARGSSGPGRVFQGGALGIGRGVGAGEWGPGVRAAPVECSKGALWGSAGKAGRGAGRRSRGPGINRPGMLGLLSRSDAACQQKQPNDSWFPSLSGIGPI